MYLKKHVLRALDSVIRFVCKIKRLKPYLIILLLEIRCLKKYINIKHRELILCFRHSQDTLANEVINGEFPYSKSKKSIFHKSEYVHSHGQDDWPLFRQAHRSTF